MSVPHPPPRRSVAGAPPSNSSNSARPQLPTADPQIEHAPAALVSSQTGSNSFVSPTPPTHHLPDISQRSDTRHQQPQSQQQPAPPEAKLKSYAAPTHSSSTSVKKHNSAASYSILFSSSQCATGSSRVGAGKNTFLSRKEEAVLEKYVPGYLQARLTEEAERERQEKERREHQVQLNFHALQTSGTFASLSPRAQLALVKPRVDTGNRKDKRGGCGSPQSPLLSTLQLGTTTTASLLFGDDASQHNFNTIYHSSSSKLGSDVNNLSGKLPSQSFFDHAETIPAPKGGGPRAAAAASVVRKSPAPHMPSLLTDAQRSRALYLGRREAHAMTARTLHSYTPSTSLGSSHHPGTETDSSKRCTKAIVAQSARAKGKEGEARSLQKWYEREYGDATQEDLADARVGYLGARKSNASAIVGALTTQSRNKNHYHSHSNKTGMQQQQQAPSPRQFLAKHTMSMSLMSSITSDSNDSSDLHQHHELIAVTAAALAPHRVASSSSASLQSTALVETSSLQLQLKQHSHKEISTDLVGLMSPMDAFGQTILSGDDFPDWGLAAARRMHSHQSSPVTSGLRVVTTRAVVPLAAHRTVTTALCLPPPLPESGSRKRRQQQQQQLDWSQHLKGIPLPTAEESMSSQQQQPNQQYKAAATPIGKRLAIRAAINDKIQYLREHSKRGGAADDEEVQRQFADVVKDAKAEKRQKQEDAVKHRLQLKLQLLEMRQRSVFTGGHQQQQHLFSSSVSRSGSGIGNNNNNNNNTNNSTMMMGQWPLKSMSTSSFTATTTAAKMFTGSLGDTIFQPGPTDLLLATQQQLSATASTAAGAMNHTPNNNNMGSTQSFHRYPSGHRRPQSKSRSGSSDEDGDPASALLSPQDMVERVKKMLAAEKKDTLDERRERCRIQRRDLRYQFIMDSATAARVPPQDVLVMRWLVVLHHMIRVRKWVAAAVLSKLQIPRLMSNTERQRLIALDCLQVQRGGYHAELRLRAVQRIERALVLWTINRRVRHKRHAIGMIRQALRVRMFFRKTTESARHFVDSVHKCQEIARRWLLAKKAHLWLLRMQWAVAEKCAMAHSQRPIVENDIALSYYESLVSAVTRELRLCFRRAYSRQAEKTLPSANYNNNNINTNIFNSLSGRTTAAQSCTTSPNGANYLHPKFSTGAGTSVAHQQHCHRLNELFVRSLDMPLVYSVAPPSSSPRDGASEGTSASAAQKQSASVSSQSSSLSSSPVVYSLPGKNNNTTHAARDYRTALQRIPVARRVPFVPELLPLVRRARQAMNEFQLRGTAGSMSGAIAGIRLDPMQFWHLAEVHFNIATPPLDLSYRKILQQHQQLKRQLQKDDSYSGSLLRESMLGSHNNNINNNRHKAALHDRRATTTPSSTDSYDESSPEQYVPPAIQDASISPTFGSLRSSIRDPWRLIYLPSALVSQTAGVFSASMAMSQTF